MTAAEIYKKQSRATEPGEYGKFFDDPPNEIEKVVPMVQGMVIDKDLLGIVRRGFDSRTKRRFG